MLSSIVDTVMDRTVVPGFSSLGYRVRSRAWSPSDLPSMEGKVALVTGANSGLGYAAAAGFARLGATVWLAVRDVQKGQDARARIQETTGASAVQIGVCDLSSHASVREFVERFSAQVPRLHVLVNNAGVLPPARETSVDGIELTLATNVIGPFLLTGLLVPILRGDPPGRVINVSSGGMYAQKLAVADLQFEHGSFDGTTAYARTKRAQVVLSELWAQRLRGSGVVVHSMHPGWADTPGVRDSLPRFYKVARPILRSAEEGADTIVWLGAADEPGTDTGRFWHDRRRRPTSMVPWTAESPQDRERLWQECVRLSGLDTDRARAA